MNDSRSQFEQACRDQNAAKDAAIATARAEQAPCSVTPMLAFGDIDYCTTHRVMGPCPFAKGGQS